MLKELFELLLFGLIRLVEVFIFVWYVCVVFVIVRVESNVEVIVNFFMVCIFCKWNCILLIFCYNFSLG